MNDFIKMYRKYCEMKTPTNDVVLLWCIREQFYLVGHKMTDSLMHGQYEQILPVKEADLLDADIRMKLAIGQTLNGKFNDLDFATKQLNQSWIDVFRSIKNHFKIKRK